MAIERNGRGVAVVLYMHEYERLVRLTVGEVHSFCDRVGGLAVDAGMTEDRLAELLEDDRPALGGRYQRPPEPVGVRDLGLMNFTERPGSDGRKVDVLPPHPGLPAQAGSAE